VHMSNPVIFKDLPATFPEEDKHKRPAAISSIVIHIVLVTILILIPLLMPDRIDHWQLMTLIAPPLAPPAAAQPAPIQVEMPLTPSAPEIQRVVQVDPGTIIMPTEIPKEIARIIEDVPSPGVQGGLPNGVVGGVIRTILLTSATTTEVTPPVPPPPPPPPPVPTIVKPVRVGGDIREPKVITLVPPVYPKLAVKARVRGTVVLEAILTAEGAVAEIQVISGNPLLTQAAVDCVKQWRYEPTYLNGEPIPVILTARVNFELEHLS
jgi:periplasmic protein TonB